MPRYYLCALALLVALCGSCSAKPQPPPDFGKVLHHMFKEITEPAPNVTYLTINGRPCIDNPKASIGYHAGVDASPDMGERLAHHARKVVVHAVRGFLAALHPDGHLPNCSDLMSAAEEVDNAPEEQPSHDASSIIAGSQVSDGKAGENEEPIPTKNDDQGAAVLEKTANVSNEEGQQEKDNRETQESAKDNSKEGDGRQSKILSVSDTDDSEIIEIGDQDDQDRQQLLVPKSGQLTMVVAMKHPEDQAIPMTMDSNNVAHHMMESLTKEAMHHIMQASMGSHVHNHTMNMGNHDEVPAAGADEVLVDNEDSVEDELPHPTLDQQIQQTAAINDELVEENMRQGTMELTLVSVEQKLSKRCLWAYLLVGSVITLACLIPLTMYYALKGCCDDTERIEVIERVARRMRGQRLNNEDDDDDEEGRVKAEEAEAENQKNQKLASVHAAKFAGSDTKIPVKDGNVFFVTSHI